MNIQNESNLPIHVQLESDSSTHPPSRPPPKKRQISLDVFRGATVVLMILANSQYWPAYSWLSHAAWDGWTLTDLVFPFFLWIVGYSSGIAYRPIKPNATPVKFLWFVPMRFDKKEKIDIWIKIFRRTILLFLLGYLLSLLSRKFMFWTGPMRVMGVLQRISICFFVITVLHVLVDDLKYQVFIMVIIQTIYLYSMFIVNVPNFGGKKCGRGVITKECSTSSYLDRQILGIPYLFQRGPYDPEGLLSTLSAIGTSFIGYTFFRLAYVTRESWKRMTLFFFYGSLLVCSGMLVDHYFFKINKPIWSTSYTLFTGGLAGIVLSLLALITDEWGFDSVFQPFVWFGMNPLVLFFGPSALVIISSSWITWGKTNLRNWIYFTIFIGKLKLERKLASFLYSLVVELGWLAFAYILYRKKIFIKL